MSKSENKNIKMGLSFIFLSIIILLAISILNLINNYFVNEFLSIFAGALYFVCVVSQFLGIIICGSSKSKHFFIAKVLLIISCVSQVLALVIDNKIVIVIFTLLADLAQLFITTQITQGCGETTKSGKVKGLVTLTLIFGTCGTLCSIAQAICASFNLTQLNLIIPFSTLIFIFKLVHLILYWILIAVSYKTAK